MSIAEWRVGEDPGIAPPADLNLTESFSLNGNTLHWTITLRNPGTRSVEIGDLAVPFNFAEDAIGERSDAVLRTATGERSDAVLRTATGTSPATTGSAFTNS